MGYPHDLGNVREFLNFPWISQVLMNLFWGNLIMTTDVVFQTRDIFSVLDLPLFGSQVFAIRKVSCCDCWHFCYLAVVSLGREINESMSNKRRCLEVRGAIRKPCTKKPCTWCILVHPTQEVRTDLEHRDVGFGFPILGLYTVVSLQCELLRWYTKATRSIFQLTISLRTKQLM
jgi:hypothetical protein